MNTQIETNTITTRPALGDTIRAILVRAHNVSRLASASGLLLGTLGAHGQTVPPTAPAKSTAPSQGLEEVVVTAQRRSETVQDVPYNISAVDSSTIQHSGALTLNDLTRVVSGLTTVDEGPGARGGTNNLTLRGLRTDSPGGGVVNAETPGQTVNSVSTYFGETPVFFPMPLYDVDHVEVLRGPQGTLYGSGAQAGTIRFLPTRPQFDKVSGQIEATASAIENAISYSNLNRDVKGILNLPIADHLALRLVAGREHDGGFIDNVDLVKTNGVGGAYAIPIPSIPGDLTSGPVIAPRQTNTNTTDQWFARGALRWQPSELVDLQVDYLHQHIDSANTQYSAPEYPGGPWDFTTPNPFVPSAANPPKYPHSTFILNGGGTYDSVAFVKSPYEDTTNLVSATATVNLGFATATSATSYYHDFSLAETDWTALFDNPAVPINYDIYPPYNFYPREVIPALVPDDTHSFVQELRLVSSGSNRLDYVVGVFYQRQVNDTGWLQLAPGITAYNIAIGMPNPSPHGDVVWNYDRSTLFQDRAAFGELTLHITPAWQMTGGIRAFGQTFSINSLSQLYLCGAACAANLANPNGATSVSNSTSFSKHVWKWNTAYDFGPELKIYATYSEGFRRGGANGLATAGVYASLPQYLTYSPDLAKNYEVGIKGFLLDRKVSYTADVYRINLTNFQFNAINLSGAPETYNGRTARSQGLELEIDAQLAATTRASLGYAYTDAKITETFELLDLPSYALFPQFGGNGKPVPLFGGPLQSGNKLPGVPENTFTFGIDHTIALPGTGKETLTLHLDGAYRSSEMANIVPNSGYNWRIPWQFIGNARATVDTGDHFSYYAFVQNFTNDPGYSGGMYYQAAPSPFGFRFVGRPRTYGLGVLYKF